jgi:hypothetical protein
VRIDPKLRTGAMTYFADVWFFSPSRVSSVTEGHNYILMTNPEMEAKVLGINAINGLKFSGNILKFLEPLPVNCLTKKSEPVTSWISQTALSR